MKRGEELDADGFVKFAEGSLVAVSGADVVAGGKSVLGIEADAQAVALPGGIDHVADLFEAIAEIGALPGGDFQSDFRRITRAGFMNFV